MVSFSILLSLLSGYLLSRAKGQKWKVWLTSFLKRSNMPWGHFSKDSYHLTLSQLQLPQGWVDKEVFGLKWCFPRTEWKYLGWLDSPECWSSDSGSKDACSTLVTPGSLCKSFPHLGPNFLICKAMDFSDLFPSGDFLSDSRKQIYCNWWIGSWCGLWWRFHMSKLFKWHILKYMQFSVCHRYVNTAI